MRCETFKKDLYRYWDGELIGAPKAELERHLTGCVSCQKESASVENFKGLLESTGKPLVQPSLGFEARFWHKVETRHQAPWFVRLLKDLEFSLPLPNVSQAFAVLLVAFLIGGSGGVVSARTTAPLSYFSGFPEFKGVPSPSITAAYLKAAQLHENPEILS